MLTLNDEKKNPKGTIILSLKKASKILVSHTESGYMQRLKKEAHTLLGPSSLSRATELMSPGEEPAFTKPA